MDLIKEKIRVHGVVCLKGVHFNEEKPVKIVEALGDEVILLPPELSFINKDKRFP